MTEPDVRAVLPASTLAAWGQDTRGARGPRPALGIDRILDAGIALAARDGLAAVSMARVAKEAGASTMALYRYVDAKEQLLDLMVDRALGAPEPRPKGERGWRAGLTRWARTLRGRYVDHPWTLKVPIEGAPTGPNNVRWLESGLDALRRTGLSTQERLSCVLLLSGFVRNEATLTSDIMAAARAAAERAPGVAPPSYGDLLRVLADADEFPEVHAALADGIFDDPDVDFTEWQGEFDFGLARLLDGIAALVARREA